MTRRTLLKSGIASAAAISQSSASAQNAAVAQPTPSPQRERLLLDFGWHFHLGHADDPAKDFGYGAVGRNAMFAKAGGLLQLSSATFDDSAWQKVDLPHDWVVELPFENRAELVEQGSKPLGRSFPETSIGWYRRVFDLPASDSGKRISIEFDGVFRDCVVIFNGHYLGANLSGYAPFQLDITDFANYGARNILAVRADATEHEGWFYEGAGIYRHVWLTRTNPVHVAHEGTFVRSEVRPGAATISITTEVSNDSDTAKNCRVISNIVDAANRPVGTAQSDAIPIAAWEHRNVEHTISVTQPAL